MSRNAVIVVTASFHGQLIESRFVGRKRRVQIGRSDEMAVPVPAGAPYLALVTRTGPTSAQVVDGQGRHYALAVGQDARIVAGGVELVISMAPQFLLRRTQAWSIKASMAWLAIVMMSTLVTQQSELVMRYRCEIFGVTPQLLVSLQCIDGESQGVQGDQMTQYLVRLLENDLAGEESGAISNEAPATQGTSKQPEHFHMPVGSDGPKSRPDGAEETSPEPVRAPPATKRKAKPKPAEPVEAVAAPADAGEPKPEPVEATEPDDLPDGVAALDAEDGDDDDDIPTPSEVNRGFGLHDWYTDRDQMREELEVKVMVEVAKRRLRIDPDSADALQLMAYYQYLAEKLPDAMATYDKFIDLYPEDSSGYNNKALVYKRRGEYLTEEALYRKALSLQPQDVTALNNLAVCLSHQGRFDEALAIMKELEVLDPNEPYADLHRAKIYADMGDRERALQYLDIALQGMRKLDTLHHIEFRQDIRVDPSFKVLRKDPEFNRILLRYYGSDTPVMNYK